MDNLQTQEINQNFRDVRVDWTGGKSPADTADTKKDREIRPFNEEKITALAKAETDDTYTAKNFFQNAWAWLKRFSFLNPNSFLARNDRQTLYRSGYVRGVNGWTRRPLGPPSGYENNALMHLAVVSRFYSV